MKEYNYQKIYFMETYYQYPSLTYNQIVLNLIDKYKIKKILFTNNNFNVCKSKYQNKIYFNQSIENKLDNIKLEGKKLLNCKLEYVDLNDKNIEKKFRIYGTKNTMALLRSKEISQYFTDCTYKCLPHELKGNGALLVLLGYNHVKDKFQLILIAILSNESADIYTEFYNFLKNTYLFKPNKITFDFSLANLKGINTVFSPNDVIFILPCLFHLTQSWWRRASKLGLRKKKYLKIAKCLIFNLQLMSFMDYDSAKEYYELVKNKFNDPNELCNKFYDYFENTWFSENQDDNVKFNFDLWSYYGKFNFKGNKKQLILENNLKEYVCFTNNAVESFNHCMNQCLNFNSKVSFSNLRKL